jgi:CHAT domain-containing protein
MKQEFPQFAALSNPEPLSTAEAQQLLRSEEVLVVLSHVVEEGYAWVISPSQVRLARLNLTWAQLRDAVALLRCSLDYTLWESPDSAQKCRKALRASPRVETVNVGGAERQVTVLPFDLARAHELYKALLGSVEDLIKDKHLLIVPSGPLTSLPFHVLVTEASGRRPDSLAPCGEGATTADVQGSPPPCPSPTRGEGTSPQREVGATGADPQGLTPTLADYRNAAWLGTRQPITVLPSVASLKALRQFAKASRASKPYLGVGNPLLEGEQGHAYAAEQAAAARGKQSCARGAAPVQTAMARGKRSPARFTGLFRGAQADIEHLRAMSPLPETADELCEVGRRLGVPESEILLGDRAREAAIKKLSEDGRLADYRVLHFATHGALTGQVQGAAEPGLILTPPAKGTADATALERDDGYLAASEIATLKLDADWVILSACNTAGGQSENAEALSGLARAFFYAGARTLLVSHWEVGSEAAVKLTTRAFAELNADAAVGRAEAFRRSMRALIETGSAADAHPAMWAPFVVVGEGGR